MDGFDYYFYGSDYTLISWEDVAPSYIVRLDDGEIETISTNNYIANVEGGSHILYVTPLIEDCLAPAAEFHFDVTNAAPEIRIVEVREGLISVAWDAIDGAITYVLRRDSTQIDLPEALSLQYNDTEMLMNAQHCYTVIAYFEKGHTDVSEAACANYFHNVGENVGQVSIFPNPTFDKVTIQCPGMTLIEVYSAEGKLVQRIKVEGDAYQLYGLESGVYTLRIMNGNDVFVRSIIKTN